MSGTTLLPWALTENPLNKARKIANKLECPTEPSQLMVDCLRKADISELKESIKVLTVYMNGVPIALFGPTLEKGTNPFLPDHPYKLLKEGKVKDLPLIVSNVKDEGVFCAGSKFICIVSKKFSKLIFNQKICLLNEQEYFINMVSFENCRQ